ncbi:hypothetical protein OB955_14680 [Halobacteria archaeon AArc-m2/3/4]|uniref:Transposase n=1 Tax=Natronoglomus mannanivorans TaxID=2979990 RepID=A0ABT2QGC8_9EURY|nr:hypothetical protein [Halobacteria archaeon AArc-m2/3/4]
MHYADRLEASLSKAIVDDRGEHGADKLATMLLEADTTITWLVGLRYNCAQAILWRRRVIFTAPVSLDQFKSQRRVNPEGKEFYNREELLEWISDQTWSWLHPRYRWILQGSEQLWND